MTHTRSRGKTLGGFRTTASLAALFAICIFVLLKTSWPGGVECWDDTNEVAEAARKNKEQALGQVEWWKRTNFYHIYLRSFKDSNGDGNGDLRGVIEQLDYLKQVGVETILMAPFYSSPMKDCGYDIDDYLGINPMFGSLADVEQLFSELKKRNMRMVVDFVPNHSSNKHAWFECSERALVEPERCGKYRDYYVWSSSRRYEGQYPTNWNSVFGGGPAWTWSEVRQQFYLHQFLPEQPDLNFTNPQVRDEFKEIARFWLRKGADGLRVDSAIYLVEDTREWRDNPPNPNWRPGDDPYDKLLHEHTRSLPESAEIVKDWRQVTEEREFRGQQKVIITEAYDAIPKLIEYYGRSPADRYADLPFNFELFKLTRDILNDSEKIQQVVMNWIEPTRALGWPDEPRGAMSPWIIWVTGNHDNKRIVNRIGREHTSLLRWLSYFLPGVPVNYYGDELPLHDANPNTIPQRTIDEGEPTRLPFRVPMAWNASGPSGGFSTTGDIWMPLNADWQQANVESLLAPGADAHNELKLFVQLQELRREHLATFVFGDAVFFDNTPTEAKNVLALARTHLTYGNLLLLANLDPHNEVIVNLTAQQSMLHRNLWIHPPTGQVQILMTNYEDLQRAPQVRRDNTLGKFEGLGLGRSQVAILKY